MRNFKLVILLLSSVVLLCSATNAKYDKKLYKPIASDATPKASFNDLRLGRELLINRCTRCHGVVSADRYSVSDWGIIVNKMVPKAKLSNDEAQLIYKYVTRGK